MLSVSSSSFGFAVVYGPHRSPRGVVDVSSITRKTRRALLKRERKAPSGRKAAARLLALALLLRDPGEHLPLGPELLVLELQLLLELRERLELQRATVGEQHVARVVAERRGDALGGAPQPVEVLPGC